jgi:hypothetical protein
LTEDNADAEVRALVDETAELRASEQVCVHTL